MVLLGNMGDYDLTESQNLKNANFAANRQDIFHYNIFAHNLCSQLGSTSGIARGIPASDFIVSLGGWDPMDGYGVGTADQQTGTFIHELGHNLGLKHGGNDHVNYKPNYLSLMNYTFQVTGLRKNGVDGIWDYSWTALPSLNENNLNENAGLSGGASIAGYGTKYYCGNTQHTVENANGPIDWNCNGNATQVSVSTSINRDGTTQVLGTQNNWAHIVFDGGLVGPGTKLAVPPQSMKVEELTYEDAVRDTPPAPLNLRANLGQRGGIALNWDPPTPVTAPHNWADPIDHYKVYRTRDGGGSALLGSSTGTTYADKPDRGSKYIYVVTAVHQDGVESARSDEVTTAYQP